MQQQMDQLDGESPTSGRQIHHRQLLPAGSMYPLPTTPDRQEPTMTSSCFHTIVSWNAILLDICSAPDMLLSAVCKLSNSYHLYHIADIFNCCWQTRWSNWNSVQNPLWHNTVHFNSTVLYVKKKWNSQRMLRGSNSISRSSGGVPCNSYGRVWRRHRLTCYGHMLFSRLSWSTHGMSVSRNRI